MGRPTNRASVALERAGDGSCRGAMADAMAGTMPDSTPPTLRGRRGRERRIADRVAADFASRHAPPTEDQVVDFDVAAVDTAVEDARREPRRPPARKARRDEPGKPGHRLPDLCALPPLLRETGSFETIRERLGSA